MRPGRISPSPRYLLAPAPVTYTGLNYYWTEQGAPRVRIAFSRGNQGESNMFCHRCGTQVGSDVQFCPNCGLSLTAAPGSPGSPAGPVWTPPANVQVAAGRWLGQGWDLVKEDLGSYILIALIFFFLSTVPFIQGSLIVGFHIYTMKKLMGRRAEVGDAFKGFNFFIPALVASLLIGLFTFLGTLACLIPGLVIA